ncbi:MAG: sigma-54-dependent Fis family transcriptional regulator [candidate division Zixibacteria bacterium]|nr:sigma-54-dependent Fis family transcriptional regulator [candidate division Zixibacteria bacterium]
MKILLVDDEKNILESVGGALRRSGYDVDTASGFVEGLSRCDNTIDVAILDVWLSDGDGVDLLTALKKKFPDLAAVMISGHSTIATAVSAVKQGAYDFLEKPLSLDRLEVILQNIEDYISLKKQRDDLLNQLDSEYRLIGESKSINELRKTIIKYAPEDAPVFISGESGTGKELVARLLHQHSPRKKGPFIAVNCAALPTELAEAELFGYEKGAFTGAARAYPGHFRRANKGVIFLDEIVDASPSLQAKLLRVLEDKKVTPLGGKQEYIIDARVVAASNKGINEEIKAGKFREDLSYRLNVLPIQVPSLRERSDDIKILADHFCGQYAMKSNKKRRRISKSGITYLESLNYPGNIRELKNYIERILIMTESSPIEAEQIEKVLQASSRQGFTFGSSLKESVIEFEKAYIIETINGAGGNIARAARTLGLERSHLYKKMKALGIDKDFSK